MSGEFEPTLAQHDSHLELRLPSRSIDAVCDPVRVAQIMRILIDNALTHTSSGTRIMVTAATDNGSVRLVVRDNGEGIDPQSISRIFEPFYTADDAQGSGLGLAIASELAERMSGRLTVVSTPGGDGVHARAARRRGRPGWRYCSPSQYGTCPSARLSISLSSGLPVQTPILSLSGYTETASSGSLENISTRAVCCVGVRDLVGAVWSGREAHQPAFGHRGLAVGARTTTSPSSTSSHSSTYS